MKSICDKIGPSLFPVDKRVLYWAEDKEDKIYGLSNNHFRDDTSIARSDLDAKFVGFKDNPYTGILYQCPRHYALVRLDNGEVFQCVTRDYKLITNKDALDVADVIAKLVFKLNGWEEFNGCYLGGTHSGSQTVYNLWHDHFSISYKKDRWVPFLRIANSYNSTVALRYDLGFLIVDERENAIAIVFESMNMELKDSHATSIEKIKEKLVKRIEEKGLDDLESLCIQFKDKMDDLGDLSVKRKDIFPLYLNMTDAKFDPAKADSTTMIRHSKTLERLMEITDRFFEEGDAYHFMKVMAYYVNNPFERTNYDEETQIQDLLVTLQRQRMVGDFIDKIVKYVCRGSQKLSDFIGKEYYERAEAVEAYRKEYFRCSFGI